MSESRGRPFAKGNQLGRGRPKGSRNKSMLALGSVFAQYSEALVKKCIAEGLKGSPVALRLCMERLVAPRRGILVQLPIRGTATAAEVDAASQKVVLAAATGQITPEDAETISRMLEGRARLIETRDLEPRIAKLEQSAGKLKEAA